MKKNILYLSPSNRWLGAQISLFVLLKMLDKEKYNPIIVCPSRKGPFAEVLESAGFHVEYLRLWNWRKYKYVLHRWVSVMKIRSLLKKYQIDLVHCNEFWTSPYGYWATRGKSIPVISHVRLNMTPKKIKDYYLDRQTRIICVCKALVEEFASMKDYKKRVIPIYNGVNLDEYNPMNVNNEGIRNQYHIPSQSVVIGLVGQISKRKGQDQLVRIAPHLIKRFSQIRFMVVGSSREYEYEKEVHDMIKKMGLNDSFVFTGELMDMPKVYRALDILVLPSLMEGFGRVVVEAEAMEIPVVVSNAGGLVEVVDPEKTGFIFSLGKDEEMLQYLTRLCENPELRKKMGTQGRKFVSDHFSQETMIKKITDLYEEILGNDPHAE